MSMSKAPRLALAAAVALAAGAVATTPAYAAKVTLPPASVANNPLTILGTKGDDTIDLSPSADPNTLLVGLGNGTVAQAFDKRTFNAVAVFLGNGDDQFVNAPAPASGEAISVDGGGDNDTIAGGEDSEILSGGSGDDTIRGGGGDDTIFGESGNDTVNGQRGNDTEILGSG